MLLFGCEPNKRNASLKDLKELIIEITVIKNVYGMMSGNVILKNCTDLFAPSISAAS